MVNLMILILLLSSLFSYTALPQPVSTQEDVSFTLYAIYSARDSVNSFNTLVHEFKGNISDDVLNKSYNDIKESKLWSSKAEDYLNKKSYDDAKKCAYYSWFLAERASHRIYVNMTWAMIQDANETITDIPDHVERPLAAENVLKNAIDKFESWSIPIVFGIHGPSFPLKGYAVSMNYNKQPLYLDEDSAYQLARQAKEEAQVYLENQTNIQTKIDSQINTLLQGNQFSIFLIAITILSISSIVYLLTQSKKKKEEIKN